MPTPAAETVTRGTNLEVKARARDPDTIRRRVRDLGAELRGTERQVDRYFNVAAGRLKLRESSFDGAHLIVYLRDDRAAARPSTFHRLPVDEPDALADTLSRMLGVGPRVEKTREVWWWKDVRIHIDEIDGQGSYLELEARLEAIGDYEEAARRVERLLEVARVAPGDLRDGSYGDAG